MRRRFLFVLGLVSTTVQVILGGGSLSGSVVDPSGASIANAAVVWVSVPDVSIPSVGALNLGSPLASASAQMPAIPRTGSVLSDANGQFRIPSLQTGNYRVCVTSLAERSHLSTCEWRGAELPLTMSGQSQALDLVIQRGSVLTFHVSDPKGRLSQDNLSVIVSVPNNGFAHARVVSLTPAHAELFVAVPFNSQMAVVVNAPAPLHDGSGAPVPLGVPAMMMTTSSAAAVDISLTAQ